MAYIEKPTVFLSHSVKNKRELNTLKILLDKKAAGFVNFFLSSDGNSIPLGANWVAQIHDALKKTKLMFVFVSKESLTSDWILFEAGHAFGNNIHVVPLCLPGVSFNDLPTPLKLLQAATVHSARDLNVLIKKCNEIFETKIPEQFSTSDFNSIFKKNDPIALPSTPSAWADITKDIKIEFLGPVDGTDSLYNLCRRKKLDPYTENNTAAKWRSLTACGMSVIEHTEWYDTETRAYKAPDNERKYEITASPRLLAVTTPVIDSWVKKLGKNIYQTITVNFIYEVFAERQEHELTTKIFGSEIKMIQRNFFRLRDIQFSLFKTDGRYDDYHPQIRVYTHSNVADSFIPELIDALLRLEVLIVDPKLLKKLKSK